MMIELISLGFAPVAAILSFLAGQWRHAEINLVTTGLPSPADSDRILKGERPPKPSTQLRRASECNTFSTFEYESLKY